MVSKSRAWATTTWLGLLRKSMATTRRNTSRKTILEVCRLVSAWTCCQHLCTLTRRSSTSTITILSECVSSRSSWRVQKSLCMSRPSRSLMSRWNMLETRLSSDRDIETCRMTVLSKLKMMWKSRSCSNLLISQSNVVRWRTNLRMLLSLSSKRSQLERSQTLVSSFFSWKRRAVAKQTLPAKLNSSPQFS